MTYHIQPDDARSAHCTFILFDPFSENSVIFDGDAYFVNLFIYSGITPENLYV